MSDLADKPACLASRHLQMLVRIARHSRIGDPEGCAAVLALLETGRVLRAHIHSILMRHGLSDAKFAVLVCLYAIDPSPITPTELASEAQISRAAMSEALESLHKDGYIARERSRVDRRSTRVSLTEPGRALIEKSTRPFLAAVTGFGDALTPGERQTVGDICINLCRRLPSSA